MRELAIVTGAAGGLGKAFAAECAARGLELFVTDLAEAPLKSLAEGLHRLHGVRVHVHACDLTSAEARARLWAEVAGLGTRLRYLINVAGVDFEGPFADRRPEELETIVRLNVEATMSMTRRALEHLVDGAPLAIVNVSSLAGFYPMPIKAVYAASKRFLLDFSRALHSELKGRGVTVTALCPAGLPTHPAVIRAIEAQGLAGSLTTSDIGRVAADCLDRAAAGRGLYIPGLANRLLRRLGSLVPAELVADLVGRRWKRTSLAIPGKA